MFSTNQFLISTLTSVIVIFFLLLSTIDSGSISSNGAFVRASLTFGSVGDFGCIPIGGWHAQDQVTVGNQFAAACEELGCAFVLNPGDNFYYCGINQQNADWFNTTFEQVYHQPSMMVDFWNTLGNHDYGYPESVDMQLNYKSPNKDRWKMPGRYYYRRIQVPGKVSISLIVLDSSPCMADYRSSDASGWDPCGSRIPGCPGCTFHQNVIAQNCTKQLDWLKNTIPTLPADDWKIVMAHAPAGDVDVLDFTTVLQDAKIDLYLNGHVHLMAHYQMDNKGAYVTSGAGCMVRVPTTRNSNDVDPYSSGKKQPIPPPGLYNRKPHLTQMASANAAEGFDERGAEIPLSKLKQVKKQAKSNNKNEMLFPKADAPINELPEELGETSCSSYARKTGHTCQLVYQKTTAGYATHTFSPDYQSLFTYIWNYEGKLLHSFSIKKGTGGGPGSSGSGSIPDSGSSSSAESSSSSGGSCCKYDAASCRRGEICCASDGWHYDKYSCEKYGYKHKCVWDGIDQECLVQ